LLFKVEVESVQVANRQGKQKRSGKTMGRRNHTRRAFVSLKPGQEINFTEEAK
jgi:large subunit ribosomal protein L23